MVKKTETIKNEMIDKLNDNNLGGKWDFLYQIKQFVKDCCSTYDNAFKDSNLPSLKF